MKENLKGKVAFITGASRGIGKSICELFVNLGIKIVAIARSEEKLKELEEEIKKKDGKILTYKLDITDFEEIGKVIKDVIGKWKTIDILINNAGTNIRKPPIESITKEEIDTVIDTNIKGTVYVTRQVIPIMLKAKSGHIINISSLAGMVSTKGNGMYPMTKAGINMFGDCISKALMEKGIYITTLCPGAINTPWWDKSPYIWGDGDRNKIMKPEEIARLIEFILKGDTYSLYNKIIMVPPGEVGFI